MKTISFALFAMISRAGCTEEPDNSATITRDDVVEARADNFDLCFSPSIEVLVEDVLFLELSSPLLSDDRLLSMVASNNERSW